MDGRFQDGWLRVIWKWNKSICTWEYWIRMGGACCLLEVPEGSSCQVNVLKCTLEGVETVVGKYISWTPVPLGYCSGKKMMLLARNLTTRLL